MPIFASASSASSLAWTLCAAISSASLALPRSTLLLALPPAMPSAFASA
eukprot:CAMPEP_0180787414 /NCGR_PEP_ID=MMETSP1038_2-20121128/51373_1 /TAXON_ID=632150 /ORGANISM="Azadinium spinosum, Strain 3D9" /LENGTH=48 /DNA_ID= /DNA_START= /DNA_END= /DNA_ORIENTATION=